MRRYGWFPWRLWTWCNARLDARKNIPSPEATALSETERQIQSGVNTSIRSAEQWFTKRADPAEGKLADLRKALQETYEPEYQRLRERTGRRDALVYLSRPVYFALLLGITLGELLYNIVAFNIFQEPALYTLFMAAAVGLSIPICAHVMGIWIRQWPPPGWVTAIKLISLAVILVVVLNEMNHARLAYLQEVTPEFVKAHPELEMAFLAINILILVGVIVLTYLTYDPEPNFAETKERLDRTNAAIRRLEGQLDQWANTFRTEVEILKETGWGLMAFYRKVNRRRREKMPRYFDDDTDKNHFPEFAAVQDIAQYHVSGASSVTSTHAATSMRGKT